MKKIILLFIIATCSSYAQDVDLANSVDYIRIQKNGESGFSRAFGLNSSNHMYIGSVEKTIGNIYFFNKGTNHLMTIKPDGNVGIGTTNPSEKLHVDGTLGVGRMGSDFTEGLKIKYVDGGSGITTFKHNRWGGYFHFKRSGSSGERTQFVLGGSSNHFMDIYNNNNEVKVRLNSGGHSYFNGGNIGIGTANPSVKLEILESGSLGSNTDVLNIIKKTGTAFTINTQVGLNLSLKQGGNSPITFAAIRAGEDTGTGQIKGALSFLTQNYSDGFKLEEKMRIKSNGNVGIGTANPSEKLTVKGKILCGEVEVVMASTIPADYVFQKYYTGASVLKADYVMPSLEEVEAFTKANHHLPDVPSAATIKEEGLQLKEMTTLLLQKVEELTLYTIEQEKRIKTLEAKLVENN